MAARLVGRGGVIREFNDVIKTTILIGYCLMTSSTANRSARRRQSAAIMKSGLL